MLCSMEVILQHMESKMFLLWWEGHKHTTVAGEKKQDLFQTGLIMWNMYIRRTLVIKYYLHAMH